MNDRPCESGYGYNDLKPFKTPGEAKAQIAADFNDWGSILTQNSIQASFAIIAANWAVHGSTGNILDNEWAKISILLILAFLAINLICTFAMTKLHYDRFIYAEQNGEQWRKEYEESENIDHWPYTRAIEITGAYLRWVKMIIPIGAAVLFIVSLF